MSNTGELDDKAFLDSVKITHQGESYFASHYWYEEFEARVYYLCDKIGAGVESYNKSDIKTYAISLGFDSDLQDLVMERISLEQDES